MTKERMLDEQQRVRRQKPEDKEQAKEHPAGSEVDSPGLASLQKLLGNRAVQRLLARHPQRGVAQRSGDGPTELDDDTASRINRERGDGQSLDTGFQEQASTAMGQDFSGVRVHTSPEADDLSRQLGAKAFTTGHDVFFREGTYDPHSSGGQKLIAHELTHVAQQGSGAVSGSGRMAVNPPGDAFEQEADATAKAVSSEGAVAQVQRQGEEEEEEPVQTQGEEAEEEEEEPIQAQEETEEEEEPVQRQDETEEEPV